MISRAQPDGGGLRFIRIGRDDGSLFPYSRYILDAAAHLKGDLDSTEVATALIEAEYLRYMGRGLVGATQLSRLVGEALSKRSTAVHTTGLVGLALFLQNLCGRPISLEKAYQSVQDYASRATKHPFLVWQTDRENPAVGSEAEVRKAISTELRAIRRNFETYKSVIHICTARLIESNSLEKPLVSFEGINPHTDAKFVSTINAMQAFFLQIEEGRMNYRADPLNLSLVGPQSVLSSNAVPPHSLSREKLLSSGLMPEQDP